MSVRLKSAIGCSDGQRGMCSEVRRAFEAPSRLMTYIFLIPRLSMMISRKRYMVIGEFYLI
jgi:hypothetical protein